MLKRWLWSYKKNQHLPQQVLGPAQQRRQQMYLMLAMFIHGDISWGYTVMGIEQLVY